VREKERRGTNSSTHSKRPGSIYIAQRHKKGGKTVSLQEKSEPGYSIGGRTPPRAKLREKRRRVWRREGEKASTKKRGDAGGGGGGGGGGRKKLDSWPESPGAKKKGKAAGKRRPKALEERRAHATGERRVSKKEEKGSLT